MTFSKTDYVRPKIKTPRKLLKQVIARMGGFCGYCGVEVVYPKKGNTHEQGYRKAVIASIDHIIPLNKGGVHADNNLICACCQCNTQKGNRDLEEFRAYLFHRLMKVPLFSKEQIEWLEANGFLFPEKHVPFFFEEVGFTFSPETGLQEPFFFEKAGFTFSSETGLQEHR